MLLLTHVESLSCMLSFEPSPLQGRKTTRCLGWREVDALFAGWLFELVPMPMREVAVVATVSTDISRIVLCYVGPSFGCPDVHAALSTRCTLDITRCRAAILELDVVFLSCRLRPNTSCLPELPDLREAAPDGFRIVMCSVSRPLSSHPLSPSRTRRTVRRDGVRSSRGRRYLRVGLPSALDG